MVEVQSAVCHTAVFVCLLSLTEAPRKGRNGKGGPLRCKGRADGQ